LTCMQGCAACLCWTRPHVSRSQRRVCAMNEASGRRLLDISVM
jgi:hypothetical protein